MALTDEQMRDALRQCPHDTIENLRVRWLYAKDLARAIESAACAERDARIAEFVTALDEEKVISHIGVFNLGDDPRKAIKDLMQWSQGVGEYFANEKLKERIAELERQLAEARKDAERYLWAVSVCESDGFGYWLPEFCLKEGPLPPSKEEADAAIDNAMQKG